VDRAHSRFHSSNNTAGSASAAAAIPADPSPPASATLWIQKMDSCSETLGGAQLELVDSTGAVISGPATSAAGKMHSFPHPNGCPVQGGSCTVTNSGCLTLDVPVPGSGTATFQIIETKAPSGFVDCIKGDHQCTSQVGTVIVASDGTMQVTFTVSFTNGRSETLPSNDPNTGSAFWLGTKADPALYFDSNKKKKEHPSSATLWIQKMDSCSETLGGAQLELVDSTGAVISGPATSAAGKMHSFPHPNGCPVQGGSCTVTNSGCLTLDVPVPGSGTATFQIIETQAPSGFVDCIKGDHQCTSQVGTVIVASDGTMQVTFTVSFTNGRSETLPSNDPNTGSAFWLGTKADPALYFDSNKKKK
jgi:hypothetical protein